MYTYIKSNILYNLIKSYSFLSLNFDFLNKEQGIQYINFYLFFSKEGCNIIKNKTMIAYIHFKMVH